MLRSNNILFGVVKTEKTMIMKRVIIPLFLGLCAVVPSSAQLYQVANQLPNIISPALSGSAAYKGFVETSYVQGIGNYKADFLEFTTTQGFRYSNWFFMGAGAGIDVMFSHTEDDWGQWNGDYNDFTVHKSTATSVMIPLYSDFRFNVGGGSSASMFVDIRLGGAFLVGKDYVRIKDGYITNNTFFYFKPTIGVRVPLSQDNLKQAVNFGVTYQLLTSDYWYNYSNNVTLNSLGVNVSFEW